uniref:flagellar filament capping protein FliD n=1 Tax=Agathobacter sp. TaxID=2021311 RepID=UPI0040572569
MAIRLSGINSGLDTDAIVQELVSAYSLKTEKYEKAQTKLSWKQEAWKTLNAKIYSLYTSASNMRLSSAYSLKKTTVSDSTKASVTASSTAPVGTQTLEVKQLAQACYMTGSEVSLSDGGKVTGDTKLSELGYTGGATTIEVVREDGTKAEIEILKSTTVSEFVKKLQENGLNANFDEANQRIFASAKKAGTENNFILMGGDKDGADALKLLGLDTALVSEDGSFTELGAQYYQADYDLFEAAKKAGYSGINGLQEYIQKQVAEYDLLEAQASACEARDDLYAALESLGIRPSLSDLQSTVKTVVANGEDGKAKLKEYLEEKGVDASSLTDDVMDTLYKNVSISGHYSTAATEINTIFEDIYLLDRPSVSDLQEVINADGLTDDDSKRKALQKYVEEQTGKADVDVTALYNSLTELQAAGIDETNISATRKDVTNTLNRMLPLDKFQAAIADCNTFDEKKEGIKNYFVSKGVEEESLNILSKQDWQAIIDDLETVELYENPASATALYDSVISQLDELFDGEDSARPTIEKLQTELAGVSSDKQMAALADYLNKYHLSDDLDTTDSETKEKLENLLSDLNKIKDFIPTAERETYKTIDSALVSSNLTVTATDGTETQLTSIGALQEAYQAACDAGTINTADGGTSAKEWLKGIIKNDTLTDTNKADLAGTLYESLQTLSAYGEQTSESRSRPSVEMLNTTEIAEAMSESMVKEIAESDDISGVDDAIYDKAMEAFEANRILNSDEYKGNGASRVNGSDAVISLNGVEFTGSSNSFNINGLAIEVTGVTTDPVSITTNTDTQGIYDKIKDFLTEYNTVINEMTKLYNADSAKDYEPLTDEEKEAMSEDQIEKWENKIKDSLLRRDTTLNSIMSSMINAMSTTYSVDGTKLSLSSFGIKTLGFLNAPDNENYAFHIDGDEDDENTSGNEDKLMVAIQENPDQVMEFMKQLTAGLYTAIDNKMKSTDMSSAYKVYNDKEMDKQYAEYTEIISKWEDKVSEKEEYYYNKFSQMEVALSRLNDQTSAISGLLG